LGHINFSSLGLIILQGLATGIPSFKVTPQLCQACHEGKQARECFPRSSNSWASKPLQLIHTDLCGPLLVLSLAKTEYFLLFTDDYSCKSWIYFLKTKDQAFEKLKHFKAMIENQTDQKIITLQSDRGGEFLSHEFSSYLSHHGISRQLTTAHTPQQNGISERKNRTILNMVRAMLIGGQVPKFLWTEVAHTAVLIINSLPTKTNHGLTPEELFSGNKPDMSCHKIFECLAFVHIDKSTRDKLSSH
jgi:transposase InsO family protein